MFFAVYVLFEVLWPAPVCTLNHHASLFPALACFQSAHPALNRHAPVPRLRPGFGVHSTLHREAPLGSCPGQSSKPTFPDSPLPPVPLAWFRSAGRQLPWDKLRNTTQPPSEELLTAVGIVDPEHRQVILDRFAW